MTKGHPLVVCAVLLLEIVVLFAFMNGAGSVNKYSLPSPFHQTRPYMVGPALRPGDWMFEVRVGKAVSYVSLTCWTTKLMSLVFVRLIVGLLSTALRSALQKKTTEVNRSIELAQKLDTHSVSLLHCTNSAQNRSPNDKVLESRVSKGPSVATLKDIRGLNGDRMNKSGFTALSTKELANMAKFHTLASILPLDIYVFQVAQLVMETATQPPARVPSLASTRPIAEDIGNRTDRPSSVSQTGVPLEIISPTNPEDPQRTIVAGNSLSSSNQSHQQPVATASINRETHPTIAIPPLPPQWTCVPVVRAVNELDDDDISTVQLLGPIEIQAPTRTLGLNRAEISGSVRNNITETWPMDGEYTRHSPTTVFVSSLPDSSPGPSSEPSPVSYAHTQSYRPIFQPLTPNLERSIQAEQPWSPELQRPAREAKFRDDFDKLDALGL